MHKQVWPTSIGIALAQIEETRSSSSGGGGGHGWLQRQEKQLMGNPQCTVVAAAV